MNAQELQDRARHEPHDIERLLTEDSYPIVEGTDATFVFHGQADSVQLRHWIHGLPGTLELTPTDGAPDLWTLTMKLPEHSRVEYKFEVVTGPDHRLICDPLNERYASDPYGSNSVVYGTGYEAPDWVNPDENARPGRIEELHIGSDAFGEPRPISVYLPARFRETRRYPLLVVHDGLDYLRFTSLQTVLDNLIHRLEIPPMVVALTESPNRLHEYADASEHATFVADELVPLLEERYPLIDHPGARGLMGASFGAVAALSTAWRHPDQFGKLLLQSGSFAFTDIGEHEGGPVFDSVVEFVNAFREKPGKPAERVFVSCGTYESMIYYNRSMIPLLQETGMQVRYRESRDGHNWENWRDQLREGLSFLFPGPLWMVYE